MKRVVIIPVISIIVMSFVHLVSADPLLSASEALAIGENAYLKFLWMVDGAFNDQRFNYSFKVNNKMLGKEDKKFKCKYTNLINCVSNNFEKEFDILFASKVDYDEVYGDGVLHTWYEKKNNEYIFKNINTCNYQRMSENHKLSVLKIERGKITYKITFDNNNYIKREKIFVINYEDGKWKIARAYYHDLCGIDYNIDE